jgi:hypothetical protein
MLYMEVTTNRGISKKLHCSVIDHCLGWVLEKKGSGCICHSIKPDSSSETVFKGSVKPERSATYALEQESLYFENQWRNYCLRNC